MLNRGKGASYDIQTSEITPNVVKKEKETEMASLVLIYSKPIERNRLA